MKKIKPSRILALALVLGILSFAPGCSSIKRWGVGVCHEDTCGNVFFELDKPTLNNTNATSANPQ